jgi:hypothetical protein
MYTRRPFAVLSSTIALVAVALLTSSRGIAVSATRAAHAALAAVQEPAKPTVDRTGRATEPDGARRAAFLHAQAPTVRTHTPHASGDGGRDAFALGVERALLDLAARRAPGAVVAARQDGVVPPGQPAPSSRAPPIG